MLTLKGTNWHNGKRIIQAFHNELGFANNLYLESIDWHNGKMIIEFAFNQSNDTKLYLTGLTWYNAIPLIEHAYNSINTTRTIPMDETNLLDAGLTSEDIDARLNYFASLDPVPIGIEFDFRGNGLPTEASADARYILTLDDRNVIMVG